jgi:hypothetical protein
MRRGRATRTIQAALTPLFAALDAGRAFNNSFQANAVLVSER